MSEITSPRIGRGRRGAAVAGAAGLSSLATAGVLAAGLDALVRVRAPMAPVHATIVGVETSSVPGCVLRVTLTGPGASDPGLAGLFAARGRLLAGPPTPADHGWWRDTAPLPGAAAALLELGQELIVTGDPWAGCDDPFGLGAVTVERQSPLGPVKVTEVAPQGGSRSAVVYLHGRGGHRHTGWWLAPTALEAGWRVVLPAYRNDPDDGPSTGRYLLGGEWVDLVAVLDTLAQDGVEQVVLAGWSMGGNIAASYLRQRHRAPERFGHHPIVRGLVLDAAALDWGVVLRHVARSRRLPHCAVPAVMTYGQLATRIDWRGLDHLRTSEHLSLPILAFHGSADDIVPVSVTERLAEALPNVVFEQFEGAGHCSSVKLDPVRYLGAFRRFLRQVEASTSAEPQAVSAG